MTEEQLENLNKYGTTSGPQPPEFVVHTGDVPTRTDLVEWVVQNLGVAREEERDRIVDLIWPILAQHGEVRIYSNIVVLDATEGQRAVGTAAGTIRFARVYDAKGPNEE